MHLRCSASWKTVGRDLWLVDIGRQLVDTGCIAGRLRPVVIENCPFSGRRYGDQMAK
jgi:hypothetical protein